MKCSVWMSAAHAAASSGSNLGPLNPDLIDRVGKSAAEVRASTASNRIPADAVTASGSGLDPDISPAYAALQVPRVARETGLSEAAVTALVEAKTKEKPQHDFVAPDGIRHRA